MTDKLQPKVGDTVLLLENIEQIVREWNGLERSHLESALKVAVMRSLPGQEKTIVERVPLEKFKKNPDLRGKYAGRKCLIFAGDGACYWKKGCCGYSELADAGIFWFEDAFIVSGHCGPEKLIVYAFLAEENLLIKQPVVPVPAIVGVEGLREALKLVKIRYGILRNRMEACGSRGKHGVSLLEIPAWIEDIDDLLAAAAPQSGEGKKG